MMKSFFGGRYVFSAVRTGMERWGGGIDDEPITEAFS